MMRPSPRISFAFISLLGWMFFRTADASAREPELGAWFQVRAADSGRTGATLDALRASGSEKAEAPKVWVYFTDKDVFDPEVLAARLQDAAEDLLPRAALRRARGRDDAGLDFHDLPVVPRYLERLREAGARVEHPSRWLNAASVHADLATLEEIATLPFVAWIEPVRAARTRSRLVDPHAELPLPSFGGRGGLDYGNSYDQLAEIGVVEAHSRGLSGAGVLVAMFDTGFDYQHETFAPILSTGRLIAQHDFVNDDDDTRDEPGDPVGAHVHGTATWSAVCGYTPSRLIGGAYGASFLLCKTEDVASETPIEEDNWVAASEWAESLGADVFSTSLAYFDWYTYEDMDGDTAPITIASDIAAGRNVVVCTAAGNLGTQDWYYIVAPADGDSVVTAGAVDQNNQHAAFSSHGPTYDGRIKPEVVARGIGVACAYDNSHSGQENPYGSADGTSMSTPLVASGAALLVEAFPALPAMAIRDLMKRTADNADTPNNDIGWGRIDIVAALDVTAVPEPAGASTASLLVVPNPARRDLGIELRLPAGTKPAPLTVAIHDAEGRLVRTLADAQGGWDSRDDAGRLLPAGVYFARARQGDWNASAKIVIHD